MRDKILMVDDDKELREEFCDCFDEYDVTQAACAEDALYILKKPNEFNLIIMDFRMPGMDGLTALEKIKALYPEKSVIMLTGHSSKDAAIRALRGKACNYIEKPFDIGKMRAVIEAELTEKRGLGDLGTVDSEGKIEHAKRFIENNCFKKITLEDVAQAVCLSPKYLSRLFQETARMGFNDYKLKIKMSQADNLLKTTGMSVEQISAKLGYENPESFIRQFKKLRGTTPARCRRKVHARSR
ncbi:MAG: DNA-binding response regulator [Candidatus Omnitrophota bacterium]